jgi:hypothetical protein
MVHCQELPPSDLAPQEHFGFRGCLFAAETTFPGLHAMADIEEDEAQTRLLELEAAVLQDVQQFGACSLVDKVKIQRLTIAVQDKLSKIRTLTRDLELLFEELDRWGQPSCGLWNRHDILYRWELGRRQASRLSP